MVEGAPLLREYTGNGIEGSNPFFSAIVPNSPMSFAPRPSSERLVSAISRLNFICCGSLAVAAVVARAPVHSWCCAVLIFAASRITWPGRLPNLCVDSADSSGRHPFSTKRFLGANAVLGIHWTSETAFASSFSPVLGGFLPLSETGAPHLPYANPPSLKDFLNALLIFCGGLRRFCVVSATGLGEGRCKGRELASWTLRR